VARVPRKDALYAPLDEDMCRPLRHPHCVMPHCALSTWTWTCIIAFAADPVETRDATMACPDRLHFRRGAHLLAFYRVAHNTRPCLGLPPPHGTHCSLCCCSLCCVRPGASQLVSCAPLSDHSPHAVARAMCHSPHGPAHAHSCLRWPSLYWYWLACALLPFGPCELADGLLRFLADDEAPKLQSTSPALSGSVAVELAAPAVVEISIVLRSPPLAGD